jgi:hypothetical protein
MELRVNQSIAHDGAPTSIAAAWLNGCGKLNFYRGQSLKSGN